MRCSYVLRGRHLNQAARELVDDAPDTLSVALGAGHGSHEAFTRAFRDFLGLTPEEVRARRSLENRPLRIWYSGIWREHRFLSFPPVQPGASRCGRSCEEIAVANIPRRANSLWRPKGIFRHPQ
ncbi:MAG: AraC family transcriptional regulator [Mesorhizobium sp.]|nr:MAG: AraC family transcriptional regulator [Mesorhizobium sp.]